MDWRATPNRDFPSPSEGLYNRRIRTLVPQPTETLQDQNIDLDKIAMARNIRQHRMASTYNREKRPLAALQHGQPVLLKQVNDKIAKWRPATVLESVSDRSYLVKNDKENIVRRNRVDLQDIPHELPTELAEVVTEARSPREQSKRTKSRKSVMDQEVVVPEERRSTSGRVVRRPGYLRDYTA